MGANILIALIAGLVGFCAGFILCTALSLGRQDDLMCALALLLEDPLDRERREHAKRTLIG